MKLKHLVIVIVVLAAASAAVFLSNRPAVATAADPRVGQPLVGATEASQAAKLRLSEGGKTVLLVRQTDGTWRDTSYFDFPADFAKLSSFISDLTSAKISRVVTTNPERLTRLEFKDSKIELLDGSDKVLWTVTLGKTAEAGGGRFVRYGDEPKAYLATLNAWLDVDPKNWADATLLTLKPEDVAKVELRFESGGPIVVARANKDAAWTVEHAPAGQRLKADKVSSLLTSLSGLRFSDSTALADPQAAVARAHARTFILTRFDGASYTVALGRKPEEKKLKAPSAPPALPKTSEPAPAEAKLPAPEFDTIPAGPVFVWITSSDAKAPVGELMKKRAFQIDEYAFTNLPQKADELFEPEPKPAAKK